MIAKGIKNLKFSSKVKEYEIQKFHLNKIQIQT